MDVNSQVTVRTHAASAAPGSHQARGGRLTSTARRFRSMLLGNQVQAARGPRCGGVGSVGRQPDACARAGREILAVDMEMKFPGNDPQGLINRVRVQRVQLAGTIQLHFNTRVGLQQFMDGWFKAGPATGKERDRRLLDRPAGHCRLGTSDHQRTGAGRLGAIGNEILGRFKVRRITIVTHGLVQGNEIPGGQSAANDTPGLNSTSRPAFDAAKDAARLKQQDG